MGLIQFTKKNIKIFKKRVFLIQIKDSYLDELVEYFDIYNADIIGISSSTRINDNKHCYNGKIIPTYDYNYLKNGNFDDCEFLITDGYYNDIYNRIKEYKCLYKRNIYFFANKDTSNYIFYKKRYQSIALKNIIVFRSGPAINSYVEGMDFSDNARAIFEYMIKNGLSDKYKLVWLVKNPKKYEGRYANYNVEFCGYDWALEDNKEKRDRYYYNLCLAKYIFFTDAYGFSREARKDQIRVQLWHGCGYKTRIFFDRCEHRYEYTIVVSELYSRIHEQIYGLREDQILVTGYPKVDWLFGDYKNQIINDLGIPLRDKYIIWAPTFRKTSAIGLSQLNEKSNESETGLFVVDTESKINELNQVLKEYNIELLIKLHPFQTTDNINIKDCSNISLLSNSLLFEKGIEVNQLLSFSNAIISDYSSIVIDYLTLNRPIAFIHEDVEEYKNSRGFVFDNIQDWLPGKTIMTFEDMKTFVKDIGNDIDSTKSIREGLRKEMLSFYDGENSKRVVEMLGI